MPGLTEPTIRKLADQFRQVERQVRNLRQLYRSRKRLGFRAGSSAAKTTSIDHAQTTSSHTPGSGGTWVARALQAEASVGLGNHFTINGSNNLEASKAVRGVFLITLHVDFGGSPNQDGGFLVRLNGGYPNTGFKVAYHSGLQWTGTTNSDQDFAFSGSFDLAAAGTLTLETSGLTGSLSTSVNSVDVVLSSFEQ